LPILPPRLRRPILDDVADPDVPDPNLEAHPPTGNEDLSAGPGGAELQPADAAEDEGDTERDDRVMRLIASRCGPEIAALVAPVSAFNAVLQAAEALADRIAEIESRTSVYGPIRAYDADECGPLQ
jgi:hypothetical protein